MPPSDFSPTKTGGSMVKSVKSRHDRLNDQGSKTPGITCCEMKRLDTSKSRHI